MKKLIVAILLALATVACSSSAPTSTAPARPTADECQHQATLLGLDFTELSIAIEQPDADITLVVADARGVIASSRKFIADCGSYAPAEAASFTRTVDGFEQTVNEIEEGTQ